MIEDSSDEENIDQFPNIPLEDSLNQTAISINNKNQQADFFEDSQAQNIINLFYSQKIVEKPLFRFDNLETYHDIFEHGIIGTFDPIPSTYFLPITILLPYKKYDLRKLREKIIEKYDDLKIQKSISYNEKKGQISLRIHTIHQLRYYLIRPLKVSQQFHVNPQILDEDTLVNKLYQFYEIVYQKLYFCEIGALILFWAYKKQFLNQEWLSESTMKLLIIAMFLGLGNGVQNVIRTYKKTQHAKQQSNALKMSKVNRKGQCIIDLKIKNYYNYFIEEKKGFFIASQKSYQKILSINPIYFPLKQKQYNPYYKNRDDIIEKMKLSNQKLSIMKLLYKIFKTMSALWNKNQKIVIDLTTKQVIYEIHSDKFQLDVIHPVSNKVISKSLNEKDGVNSKIKLQLNHLMNKIKNSPSAIELLMVAFTR